jgi:hypothetical protein
MDDQKFAEFDIHQCGTSARGILIKELMINSKSKVKEQMNGI